MKYRYSLPFCQNKLSNNVPHGIERSDTICEQINCFRRLWIRRIAPAEFLSCSMHCSLPRIHAAVLGNLRIRLWKPTWACRKQRWPFLECQANINSNEEMASKHSFLPSIQLYEGKFDLDLDNSSNLICVTYIHEYTISIPYPILNCPKTLPFTVAHTYIAYIWEYPPSPRDVHSHSSLALTNSFFLLFKS